MFRLLWLKALTVGILLVALHLKHLSGRAASQSDFFRMPEVIKQQYKKNKT